MDSVDYAGLDESTNVENNELHDQAKEWADLADDMLGKNNTEDIFDDDRWTGMAGLPEAEMLRGDLPKTAMLKGSVDTNQNINPTQLIGISLIIILLSAICYACLPNRKSRKYSPGNGEEIQEMVATRSGPHPALK